MASEKLQEFLAEMKAMGREAVKDVRQTVHEAYFGAPEHAPEPGAPLNKTARETYEEKHSVDHSTIKDVQHEFEQ
ncbi:hypothetical protein [Fimbriiglobus ruber]|uniref:Uncharacterized protein n=1 Tax=Fimbriiglobus ruber TaxID=1908690 RepID=A0A225DTU8_9BACT|nr:hypothetical protein [Fimbriiglobus ruber]OWK35152.1 hypothetical protein FRUB_09994 [Fimbriiglobus ruber]OWK41968.1 hypothetical protein FRUB_04046 [Fimbriiglobus ruber]